MRTSALSLVMISILGLSTQGCVKKSVYEAAQAEHDKTRAQLESDLSDQKDHSRALEKVLAEEQGKSKELQQEIERLTKELEGARAKQVELQNQLTDTVRNASSLKASVREMQSALAALQEQRKQTEARIAEYRKLLDSFKKLIDAGKLKVKVIAGRMIIELPSDILFDSGSVELSEAGMASIAEVGTIFAQMKDRQFQVEGHTDDQPIRTSRFPNNWHLAAGRAIAVAEILVKSGVSPSNVSAASFGEFRPATANTTPQGRAQNRRIEIVLVPDLSKVPGFEELDRASKG